MDGRTLFDAIKCHNIPFVARSTKFDTSLPCKNCVQKNNMIPVAFWRYRKSAAILQPFLKINMYCTVVTPKNSPMVGM